MSDPLIWRTDVPKAISLTHVHNSPLLILTEPTSPTPVQAASYKSLLTHTFTHPATIAALSACKCICLRLRACDTDKGYAQFKAFVDVDDAPGVYVLSCAGVVKGRLHRGGIAGFVSPKRLVDFFAAEWADVVVRYDTWMAVQRIREAKGTIGNAGDESADAKGTVHADARKEKERSVSEERIEQARVTEKPPRDGPLTVKLPATGMSLPRPRESRLRARLPSGECITCTYPSSTKFGEIRTWICGASALAPGRVHIASHVPRHVYGMGDDEKMISELGLEPSAVLVVTKGEEGAVVGLGFGMERGRGFVWAVWEYLRGIFMAVLKAFNVGNERGRGVMTFERRAEGERGRGRGEVDEDELRFNGNGTQFGYDPNVDDRR